MEILLIDFKSELDLFNEKYLNDILCQYYIDDEELQSRDKFSNPIVSIYIMETLLLMVMTYYDTIITDYCNVLLYVVNLLYSIYLVDVVTVNNYNDHLFSKEYCISLCFFFLWLMPSTYYNSLSYSNDKITLLYLIIIYIVILSLNIQYMKCKLQNFKYINIKYNYKYRTCNICHKFGGNDWMENRHERKKTHLSCLESE